MFTRLFLISILVVLSTAPVLGGPIYVSRGNQIVSVDSDSGAVTVLYSPPGDTFKPRGLTVGPDGNLYIAEASGAVYRLEPTPGSEPTIFNVPGTPEGLAFAGNFDLYVSTSGPSGKVYRLHFQPSFGISPPPHLGNPDLPIEAFSFGSGAGIAFGENGNLLVAKNTNNGGIFAAVAPTYSSASSLGPALSKPIGVGVNTCGEILVGVGRKIERHDKKTGEWLGDYVTFGGGKVVRYTGVTSTNEVFAVVTNNSGSNGQVYRVAGVPQSTKTTILSCTNGTATALGASMDYPVGLAVPASSAEITKSFGAGPDNTCGTSDDALLTSSSQTFNFGHHLFTLSFKQVIHCFPVTVTAAMSRPQRVTFNTNFPPGTEATKFSSKGSFAIEYLAVTGAISGSDYSDLPDGVQVSSLFFTLLSLESPPRFPGMAKSDDEVPEGPEYDQDITQHFFPSINPLEDPGESGTDDDISRFVVFNGPIPLNNLCEFNLNQPAFSGNPPWRQGSTLSVKFSCSNNGSFSDLVAYLTVVKINADGSHTPQPVVSKGNEIGNKFSSGSGNNFTYQLDTSFLAIGTHQLIITSNRFTPRDGNDGNPLPPDLDPPIIVTVEP
jgi:hypothetical protein